MADTAIYPQGTFGYFASVAAPFLVGFVLLASSAPRLAGALAADPERVVFDALAQGRPVPASDMDRAAAALLDALAWHANATDAANLASLRLVLSRSPGIDPELRRQLLDLSIRTNRWSLAHKPAQAFAWMNLALAEAERAGAGPELDPLLRLAIRTGPYEPRLVMPRLELAFSVWPDLSAETKTLVREQILVAAFYDPEALVGFAHRRNATAEILDALATDDMMLLRFQTAFFRL